MWPDGHYPDLAAKNRRKQPNKETCATSDTHIVVRRTAKIISFPASVYTEMWDIIVYAALCNRNMRREGARSPTPSEARGVGAEIAVALVLRSDEPTWPNARGSRED